MNVEATMPEVRQGVETEKAQRQVNAQLTALGQGGRRLALAYVGLWGCAYDRAAGVYRGGLEFWDHAIERGQKMEQTLQQRIAQLERHAAKQFDRLQNRVGDNVELVTRSVSDTGESFEVQLEKQVERVLVNLGIPTRDRLERLNQEIDRLNARLDEELAYQEAVHA